MIGYYNYTTLLTYLSLASATTGIVVSLMDSGHPYIAMCFLLFCGLCDAFDGKVARIKKNRTERECKFGIQIDSLSDIGTVVFPNAELKIYMTADAMVRAERRYKELTAKGDNVSLEEIYENVVSRDKADMSRAISPLRKADDAIVLDNSHMSVEEQMAWFDREYQRVLGC